MVHNLVIHSLNDAQATCNCGFYLVATGAMTKAEIEELHND